MEEFILEGEPFKFSYEGVDYSCEVIDLERFNGLNYYRIDLSVQRVYKIFRWDYRHLVHRYSFTCSTEGEPPYRRIGNKKYFSPELIKDSMLTKFKEIEVENQAERALKERIKNIKIVKEL